METKNNPLICPQRDPISSLRQRFSHRLLQETAVDGDFLTFRDRLMGCCLASLEDGGTPTPRPDNSFESWDSRGVPFQVYCLRWQKATFLPQPTKYASYGCLPFCGIFNSIQNWGLKSRRLRPATLLGRGVDDFQPFQHLHEVGVPTIIHHLIKKVNYLLKDHFLTVDKMPKGTAINQVKRKITTKLMAATKIAKLNSTLKNIDFTAFFNILVS